MDEFDKVLDRVLASEGGYVDHPSDRGGCTKFGVTRKTLERWREGLATCDDVRALTLDEARHLYRELYWVEPRIYQLSYASVRELVFDCGVHHGTTTAIQFLQDALRTVAVDGIIGPETLAATLLADPDLLCRSIIRRRLVYLGAILTRDHDQAAFALGWLSRVAQFV